MSDRAKHREWLARGLVAGVLLGLVALIALARWRSQRGVVEVLGLMSETGGWSPAALTTRVGEPLRLRLAAGDVMHGFAVGQQDWPAIDLIPGQPVETELVFNRPGKYTFYCTRWCGLNHWRMRGVIEVKGETTGASETSQAALPAQPPLYVTLGINLDAPHPAAVLPNRRPRAFIPDIHLAEKFRSLEFYQSHSPAQAWSELRRQSSLASLDDAQIWDLVAGLWQAQTTPEAIEEGARLYAANCAACHGETGAGDGVMAEALTAASTSQSGHPTSSTETQHAEMAMPTPAISGHTAVAPTDFTAASQMLGASPALLHGKIVRGGMGTGMPYWGPIFTDDQLWSLVAYLWTFQFDYP